MFNRVGWMVPADHAILTLLGNSDLKEGLQPTNIARNIGYSADHTRDRCRVLTDHNLVTRDAEGTHPFYAITDKGRQYLAGGLEPSDLEED